MMKTTAIRFATLARCTWQMAKLLETQIDRADEDTGWLTWRRATAR